MAVKKAVTTADIKVEEPKVEKGYVRVTSPIGIETVVPESIVDVLIKSGYSK